MPKIKRKKVGECPCPHAGCGELCEVKRINDVGNYFLDCPSHGVLRYKGIHDFVLDNASLANPDGSMPGDKKEVEAEQEEPLNIEVIGVSDQDNAPVESPGEDTEKAEVVSIDKNKKNDDGKPEQKQEKESCSDWFEDWN